MHKPESKIRDPLSEALCKHTERQVMESWHFRNQCVVCIWFNLGQAAKYYTHSRPKCEKSLQDKVRMQKRQKVMITVPWALELMTLCFPFICSSWLTDLFGFFKINLTEVTIWDPHDFHFTTRNLFLFKFPLGQGVVWAAVSPKLHTHSLTRSLSTVRFPSGQLETSN